MEQVKQTEEEFMRGVWVEVDDYKGEGIHVAIRHDSELSSNWHSWSAAAAFTRERLEEVRQLREEIAETKKDVAAFARRTDQPSNPEHAVYQRILARLESILADKTAGMKEGA